MGLSQWSQSILAVLAGICTVVRRMERLQPNPSSARPAQPESPLGCDSYLLSLFAAPWTPPEEIVHGPAYGTKHQRTLRHLRSFSCAVEFRYRNMGQYANALDRNIRPPLADKRVN